MSKTITLTRDDIEEVIRTALRLGSQSGGVKHKRLVQAVLEEAEEKAEDVMIRMPIKFDISARDLELVTASDPAPNCNCHGGCGVEDCPGYGEAGESSYEDDLVSYEEARRRKVVAEMTMAEMDLAQRERNLESYDRLLIARAAAKAGIPAWLLTGDMSKVSSSVATADVNKLIELVRQLEHGSHPIWETLEN